MKACGRRETLRGEQDPLMPPMKTVKDPYREYRAVLSSTREFRTLKLLPAEEVRLVRRTSKIHLASTESRLPGNTAFGAMNTRSG